MRITNSMISNSSQAHITNAKRQLLRYQDQYTSGKKIQRPSDDPSVAVRSLQLRSSYSQIMQYANKNVQAAIEWMTSTETAITTAIGIMSDMKHSLNRGAADYLGSEERNDVLQELKQYVEHIFSNCGNQNYAGRYMFTGYRTDTSLIFEEDTSDLQYEITQEFTGSDIRAITHVVSGARYEEKGTEDTYGAAPASEQKAYRIQLAYDDCLNGRITGGSLANAVEIRVTPPGDLDVGAKNALTNVEIKSSTDEDAYDPEALGVDAVYLYDTGEVILSETAYKAIQANSSKIAVQYSKEGFEKGEVRPEMYFECTKYDKIAGKNSEYNNPSGQEIRYEIDFNQMAHVNVQARDAFSTDIYRMVDYIEQTVLAIDDVEKQLANVETMIGNTTDETELDNLNKLKEMLEAEQKLRTKVMTDAFEMGLTMVDQAEEKMNVTVADLGARAKRVEMTRDSLDDETLDMEEKLSDTEDVNIADAYIAMSQADTLYQAALSATAKILGNSLLNYI